MGRKIPGKKHKGVKDPLKQKAKREAELENKINAPPKNLDEQDIPKSLQRLIKLKNAVKNNGLVQKKKKKKKKKNTLITLGAEQNRTTPHPKSKPEKVVPIFNQRPGESNYHFWERVKRESHAFVKETQFETKYNVEVKRSADTGVIEGIVKKSKDEIEFEKLKAKHKNIGKKKKVNKDNVKLTKSQKKKEKLLQKQQKNTEDDVDEFTKFKDNVEFGEIAHAPPQLVAHPKNINKDKFKNLLLTSMLKTDDTSKNQIINPVNKGKQPINKEIKLFSKTGKRKNLPIGERRQLEKQQKDIVTAYRLLKARKGESAITA